jgi:hypothetical protein
MSRPSGSTRRSHSLVEAVPGGRHSLLAVRVAGAEVLQPADAAIGADDARPG